MWYYTSSNRQLNIAVVKVFSLGPNSNGHSSWIGFFHFHLSIWDHYRFAFAFNQWDMRLPVRCNPKRCKTDPKVSISNLNHENMILLSTIHMVTPCSSFTQRNLFETLLNQPEIRLYLSFFD